MTEKKQTAMPGRKSRKWRRGCFAGLGLFAVMVAAFFILRPGIFVVQPIGAVPEGRTIVYLSRGPNLHFVDSPDAMCSRKGGGVNLLCRGVALGAFGKNYEDEIVLRLPYIDALYLWTTGGLRYEK